MRDNDSKEDVGLQAVETVEIYEGNERLGITVIENGSWHFPILNLGTGKHVLEARTRGLRSGIWTLDILAPFTVDPTAMHLSGTMVLTSLPLSGNDAVGTAERRTPTGGLPPYTYTSSQPSIASVDSSGTVRSGSNGSATITVKDSLGAHASYLVTISNVYRLVKSSGPYDYSEAMAWVVRQGARITTNAEIYAYLRAISVRYVGVWLTDNNHWYGTGTGNSAGSYQYGFLRRESAEVFHSVTGSYRYGAVAFVPT